MTKSDTTRHDSVETQEITTKQKETILLELKMILETVKNIDKNITKSIELLQDPSPVSMNAEKNGRSATIDLNYNDLVKRNTQAITDILKMLDRL